MKLSKFRALGFPFELETIRKGFKTIGKNLNQGTHKNGDVWIGRYADELWVILQIGNEFLYKRFKHRIFMDEDDFSIALVLKDEGIYLTWKDLQDTLPKLSGVEWFPMQLGHFGEEE